MPLDVDTDQLGLEPRRRPTHAAQHHEGLRVEELLLSGGGVLAPGAQSYIEQATARTTRTWNPLEGLRIAVDRVDVEELEAWAPSLVVTVGLASRVRTA